MNHKPVLDEQLRTDSCVTFVCSDCGGRFVFNKAYVEKVYGLKFDNPGTIVMLQHAAAVSGDPCQPKPQ